MSKVICVAMNKGGAGKTSLTTNLASALTTKYPKKQVLIVDADSQGNCSLTFGKSPDMYDKTIYDAMLKKCEIEDVIVPLSENLYLIPSNDQLSFLPFEVLTNLEDYDHKPFSLLAPSLNKLRKYFDYIFIDTPPSIETLTCNALVGSDLTLIPFVPEHYPAIGLIKTIEAINDFKNTENPNLKLLGVVGMMVNSRTNLHTDTLQKAYSYCNNNNIYFFKSKIGQSIRFSDSSTYKNRPAVLTHRTDPIVQGYYSLLKEFIKEAEKHE